VAQSVRTKRKAAQAFRVCAVRVSAGSEKWEKRALGLCKNFHLAGRSESALNCETDLVLIRADLTPKLLPGGCMLHSRIAGFPHFSLGLFPAVLLAVASLAAAQETVIHSFPSHPGDGKAPGSGLVADGTGAFYGVTTNGGTPCSQYSSGCGVAYKLTPPASGSGPWTEEILYSFTGKADGGFPNGNLLIDGASKVVYGTASIGGAGGDGGIFTLTPGNPWTENLIYSFKADRFSAPTGGVVSYHGDLFGVASGGSRYDQGVLYRLRPLSASGGSWEENTLYVFDYGLVGAVPPTPIVDGTGNLYGTTRNGPSGADGMVYKIAAPAGGSGKWTLTTLYSFTGGADGGDPLGSLMFDSSGALYGTTAFGGAYNFGTVFKLTPPAGGSGAWTESALYSFTGGADGGIPGSAVIFDSAGNLYGTTDSGGDLSCRRSGGCGVVFKLTPPTVTRRDWTESVEYAFAGGSDGYWPFYPPILGVNGTIYGTTTDTNQNTGGNGIAYEITP